MPRTDTKVVTAKERTLHAIYGRRELADERVGVHEDKMVAADECDRLDREARQLGQDTKHYIVAETVLATDDPEDGNPDLDGPIVSSEHVTAKNLKRGERPPSLVLEP